MPYGVARRWDILPVETLIVVTGTRKERRDEPADNCGNCGDMDRRSAYEEGNPSPQAGRTARSHRLFSVRFSLHVAHLLLGNQTRPRQIDPGG